MWLNWVPVVSRAVAAAAYDQDERQLYLRFHSGKIYRYFEFPPDQYDEFLGAESRGRHFGALIRGRYRDEEVNEAQLYRRPTYFSGK